MLHTGTLLRAEIYDDHTAPYTNVKAVYEAHKNKYPGKLIVTNTLASLENSNIIKYYLLLS